MKHPFGTFLIFSIFWSSCVQYPHDPYSQAASLYTPQYASGFLLKEEEGKRILYVKKSWLDDEHNYFTYVLYPRNDSLLYKGKTGHIPYPLKNVVCLSTTHIAYLDAIEQSHLITGVSGVQYLSNQRVRKRATDVGYEGAINYEVLRSLHPDVVFAYGITGISSAYLKPLAKMGVPVVFMGDWMEAHPLGKAEYLVAFSAFFETTVMERAIDTFHNICSAYNNLSERSHAQASVPKVLMNAPFKDIWYIPGGDNYMTKIVMDAGGVVSGSKTGVRESRGIPLEQGYLYALEADFWFHPNAYRSLDALIDSDTRFIHIPAFKGQRVYNNTLRSTPGGGSDFWETGVTEPHIILADIIKILHPGLLPEHQLVYYEQLKYK